MMNGINKYAKITSLLDKLQKQFFLKLSKNRQPSQKQDVLDGEKYKMNKSQQESWLDRFEKGFADPLKYDDQLSIIKDSLLDFISTELQRILNEVEENLKFNQPKEFDTQTFRNYIAVEIDKLRKLNEKRS